MYQVNILTEVRLDQVKSCLLSERERERERGGGEGKGEGGRKSGRVTHTSDFSFVRSVQYLLAYSKSHI